MAESAIPVSKVGSMRRASGFLKRDMGFFAVLVFAVSSIGLVDSGTFLFSTVAGFAPGSNLVGFLVVTLAVSMVMAYTYAAIGAAVPRLGADYLLASRVISPPLAFATSWMMVIFFAFMGGAYVASIAQTTLPNLIQILSFVTYNRELLSLAEWAVTPYAITLIGTVGVCLIFLVLVLPPWVTRRVLQLGLLLSLLAWGVIYAQLLTTPNGGFSSAWDAFMGEGAFLARLMEARRLGMQVDFSSQTMASAGLLLAFWIFYGYSMPTCFAAEVRRPERNLWLGSAAGLLVSFALLAIAALLLMRQVPLEWLAAESYLHQSAQYSGGSMPWIAFYAAVLRPAPALVWVTGIGWIFAMLTLAHTFLYAASRAMLAWTADRMLPSQVAVIHPSLNSPVVAVLLVCIVAELGVMDAALNGSMFLRFNPLFFMVDVQLLPILAITLMPYLKRDWFAAAPAFVRIRIGPFPLVTLLGGLAVLYLSWMTTANSLMQIFGGIGAPTMAVFVVVFGSGLLWFYARQSMLAADGQETRLQFQKLPED